MEEKNKKVLLDIFTDMEDFAKMKSILHPPIYVLGGSGCIIGNYINRATIDIDLVDMNYSSESGRLFRLLGTFDLLDQYVTTIAKGFEERAKKIEKFKYLDIYVLSKEDIIVTKIGRYSKKDVEDISKMLNSSNKDLLLELTKNVISRNDLSEIIKDEFSKNLLKFKEQFNV
jgi:hypothetical protein